LDGEFDLIARYFKHPAPSGMLGVGDDCALFSLESGRQVAASTDLLIEGRHFFPDVAPRALGHKALAVNVSDLAAMGAAPLGCLLGLSLPTVDHEWLQGFSKGFLGYARESGCPLLGGDTTRSPQGIVISVTVFGQVPQGAALRRDAARVDDDIWITGTLGAAHAALRWLSGEWPPDPRLLAATRGALEQPMPPLGFARGLPGIAHAALDISDGLAQDLGHILAASGCGAVLDYAALPADPALAGLPAQQVREAVLVGGDVYQLCFTAPARHRERIAALGRSADVRVTRVGRIAAAPGLRILDADGRAIAPPAGFDHFLSR